jgi:hypothetical protein
MAESCSRRKQLGDNENYIINAVGSAGHVARRWEEIINYRKVMIGIDGIEAREINRKQAN